MIFFVNKWKELRRVKADLAARDWFYGTCGSLSMRISQDPLTFFINVDGKDKRQHCEDDFVVVNSMCEPVFMTGLQPSSEAPLHAEIYKKTKAGSVLHISTVNNQLIADLYREQGEVMFEYNNVVRVFGKEGNGRLTIPIIANEENLTFLLDEDMPCFKEEQGAVLIRNQGIVVWGKTPQETKKWLEGLEFVMDYHVKLLMIKGTKSSVI
ncbi:class II aldolase/adducin family protein [Bacillus sp. 165]|uniref:class II aldolase/adducin family protein n=1 Tax=Bacillus sp. 165 TaxID=1529117 RepID=UPI001ADAF0B4|nr:class II aldolase/adducin family protein [Bacillus sp. 165]MBO9128450.1 class II aldolase/adducin family protein [Bacillus sp. 165]